MERRAAKTPAHGHPTAILAAFSAEIIEVLSNSAGRPCQTIRDGLRDPSNKGRISRRTVATIQRLNMAYKVVRHISSEFCRSTVQTLRKEVQPPEVAVGLAGCQAMQFGSLASNSGDAREYANQLEVKVGALEMCLNEANATIATLAEQFKSFMLSPGLPAAPAGGPELKEPQDKLVSTYQTLLVKKDRYIDDIVQMEEGEETTGANHETEKTTLQQQLVYTETLIQDMVEKHRFLELSSLPEG